MELLKTCTTFSRDFAVLELCVCLQFCSRPEVQQEALQSHALLLLPPLPSSSALPFPSLADLPIPPLLLFNCPLPNTATAFLYHLDKTASSLISAAGFALLHDATSD